MKKYVDTINSIDVYISAIERSGIINACFNFLQDLSEEEKKTALESGLGSGLRKLLRGMPEEKMFDKYKTNRKS